MKKKPRHKTVGSKTVGSNADFIKRAEQMLEKLWPVKAELEQQVAEKTLSLENLKRDRTKWIEKFALDSAPNIEIKTIARLRKKLPFVFSAGLNERLEQAHDIKVPFFTWIFGGGSHYRARIVYDTLAFLRFRIKEVVEHAYREGVLADLGALETNMSEGTAAITMLKARIESLDHQIKWLTQTIQLYGREGAPRPNPKIVEAIERGDTRLRQYETSTSRRNTRDDDDDFWRTIIFWEMMRDDSQRRNGSYRDFDGSGGSFGGAGAGRDYPAPTREPEDRLSPSQDGGFTSTRASESAPRSEGRASMRMTEAAPIIANPFEDSSPARSSSEGQASMRMADSSPSYSDRNESGSGTKY